MRKGEIVLKSLFDARSVRFIRKYLVKLKVSTLCALYMGKK